MKKYVWRLMIAASFAVLAFGQGGTIRGASKVPLEGEPSPVQHVQADNLLANGNMEEGFYWKYPNHFVANDWLRWWKGNRIPEYDDIRDWRPWRYDGHHAQVYFRWGEPYTAGIHQQVEVEPCVLYQFSMYGRNHSGSGIDHHARIGIDPLGREYDLYMPDLPSDIIWSPEQTFFYTWGLHTVTAESRGDHITVITYVSPDPGYYPYDTFWDAGILVKTPWPPGPLPDSPGWNPDGFITEVVSYTQPGQLIIEWETAEPASTQVRYRVVTPTSPITTTLPSTPTSTLLLPAIYLPLITNWPVLDLYTPVDQTGATHHQATIQWLEDGQTVQFVILARHLVEETCRTSSSVFFEATVHFSGTVGLPQNSTGDTEVKQ